MRTVAKRLVGGMAAAAQADAGASAETEKLALRVADFEVAFHPDGPVGIDDDFRWHSLDPSKDCPDAIINPNARPADIRDRGGVPVRAGSRSVAAHSGENDRGAPAPAEL